MLSPWTIQEVCCARQGARVGLRTSAFQTLRDLWSKAPWTLIFAEFCARAASTAGSRPLASLASDCLHLFWKNISHKGLTRALPSSAGAARSAAGSSGARQVIAFKSRRSKTRNRSWRGSGSRCSRWPQSSPSSKQSGQVPFSVTSPLWTRKWREALDLFLRF